MAGRKAGFAHVRDVGAWVCASPRVQRVVAAHVCVLLAMAIGGLLVRRPGDLGEPMRVAAAVGPVDAIAGTSAAAAEGRPTAVEVARSHPKARPRPRSRPKPTAPVRDWSYWSTRIRGCESYGRTDAPPNYKAKNPGSSASGAYQIVDATWAGRYGVAHASDATPEQQEAAAADLYRRHGTADWAASASCWR